MKIQLLSDLHLEANPGFVPQPAPDVDVLVLAGDIGSYQLRHDGSRMAEPDWGLQRFSPLPQYAGWPVPVLYVPGNHEYDALDVDEAHARLRTTCERLGLIWLERETVVLDGVRFIGTTLWSDYDALVPANAPLTTAMKQREKAFRAANFYLRKMAGSGGAPCSTPPPCATGRWSASPGWTRRWHSPLMARRQWLLTSRLACAAPTHAMA